VACWLPLQPVVTEPYQWRRVAVLLLVAAIAAAAMRFRVAPLAGAGALILIPFAGGVVNNPQTPHARTAPAFRLGRSLDRPDAVFLFPDAGRSLSLGVFRSEALRAVYVDWKGGGQVNFNRPFSEEWWRRWAATMAPGFHPPTYPNMRQPASTTSWCSLSIACPILRCSPTRGMWCTRFRTRRARNAAHALVRAVSRLFSTCLRFASPCVGTSADAARMSACATATTAAIYSYRSTSAGAILVALRAGYNVARKLTRMAAAAIHTPSTQCASNGTKLSE